MIFVCDARTAAVAQTWKAGENVTAMLNGGTLTISGRGDMRSVITLNYAPQELYWCGYFDGVNMAKTCLYVPPNIIAVYVFGTEIPALNKSMTTQLITALTNSGRYQISENYKAFFNQADEEQKRGAASMNSNQLKSLGQRFGVEYICVAEITTVLGEKQVSAYIFDVKTTGVIAMGASDVSLKTQADLTTASEQIVNAMFKKAPPHR